MVLWRWWVDMKPGYAARHSRNNQLAAVLARPSCRLKVVIVLLLNVCIWWACLSFLCFLLRAFVCVLSILLIMVIISNIFIAWHLFPSWPLLLYIFETEYHFDLSIWTFAKVGFADYCLVRLHWVEPYDKSYASFFCTTTVAWYAEHPHIFTLGTPTIFPVFPTARGSWCRRYRHKISAGWLSQPSSWPSSKLLQPLGGRATTAWMERGAWQKALVELQNCYINNHCFCAIVMCNLYHCWHWIST